MDQIKIGRFIAEQRKKNNLTQVQLAQALGITDRAVSKWENGKAMPDSALMIPLCKELKINVNDLLNGEIVTMEHYQEKNEKQLLELLQQKQESDKHFLHLEIVIGVLSLYILLSLTFIAAFFNIPDWTRIVLIVCGFIPSFLGLFYALRIEQLAGYYECRKCHHKYVPTYQSVLFAMHVNRTRYMKCPHCQKKSWQKKILSKD